MFAVHEHHADAVPFENLNPLMRLPVEIDEKSLFHKIVDQHRGGYCFEQNGLLKIVLEQIGFDVMPLAGRVLWRSRSEDEIPRRTHMILLVTVDGKKYLSDVGFGGQGSPQPLEFVTDKIQNTYLGKYLLVKKEEVYFLRSLTDEGWRPMYRFKAEAVPPVDYVLANWYTSTHPDSNFLKSLGVSMLGRDCRYKLSNNKLTIQRSNGRGSETLVLKTPEEILEILDKVFGLRVDDTETLKKALEIVLEKESL